MKSYFKSVVLITSVLFALGLNASVFADKSMLDSIHFLIPSGVGSVPGGMNHLVAALSFEAVKYIAYGADGKAIVTLPSNEVVVVSTGLSEAIDLAEVRILPTTAP